VRRVKKEIDIEEVNRFIRNAKDEYIIQLLEYIVQLLEGKK